jgi:hypothetical protein
MMSGTLRTLPLVAVGILLAACNLSLFPDAQPVLSNVNGAALPAGPVGSTIVLAGAGFGDAQGTGRVLFTPTAGGPALTATVESWKQAAVVAIVPVATPGDYAVGVQSGNGITSGARLFTVTPAAPFNASAVTWTAAPTLPGAVSGAGVAFAQIGSAGYVYVVGGAGAGGAPVATVSYAVVASNGTLGAWTATTALPTALEFPAAVAATQRNSAVLAAGYLYVLGGATSASGTPVSTVYRAPINADGSLGGSWTTVTALPVPLRSVAGIIQYGSMYVIGGAAASSAVVTAYRSPIQLDGSLNSSWKTQGALPAARARFGFGALGLYLYIVGGESDALAPNDTGPSASRTSTVYFAMLNPSTRDIATSWTATTTALPAARSAHSAVFGSGNLLVTGGLYPGASTHTSEQVYAPVNADGTLGTFATATPTTSINSLCGCNLFNHGATGYLAGNGSFHVLIVGGDDVNAVGTRRAETFTY